MKLSNHQMREYEELGYLLIPDLFTKDEVKWLIDETIPLKVRDAPEVIWEEDKQGVRALMGCHLKSKSFKNLVSQPRVLTPSRQLLKQEVYVYQFKINLKTAFNGDIWPWHQDYIFWHELDGMPSPESVNISIFLDDCTEFNGPLWLIPGSHREGMIRCHDAGASGEWDRDVAADLTFKLDSDVISRLVDRNGMVSPKAGAGSVLIFHPNIVHASLPNISPFERKIIIITYNSIANIPIRKGATRPEFLVNSDTSPEVESNIPLVDVGEAYS